MPNAPINQGKITVQELKGLNEREQFANPDLGYFDVLKGCVPTNKNTLTKAFGCKFALNFGEPILAICQTNDSRKNVIVQTQSAVRVVTEEELFGQPIVNPNLTLVAGAGEEETMSRAIIVHQLATGVAGGTYTTANVWQQAPLNTIVSQLNPDGTAAAFATLATGVYRIRGWSIMSNLAGQIGAARLFNVTSGLPAWNGAANEISHTAVCSQISAGTDNIKFEFGGDLNLAVPTIFEIQGNMHALRNTNGFGNPQSGGVLAAASKELYRWLEVLKTA
jgi:hypothetical protein